MGNSRALLSSQELAQRLDRDNLESPGAGKAPRVVAARHAALGVRGVYELAQEAGWGLTG